MNFQDHLQQLDRLDRLIVRKGTGTPQDLAQKFNISLRSVYRLIDDLRAFGFTICYDSVNGSYYYADESDKPFNLNLGPNKKI